MKTLVIGEIHDCVNSDQVPKEMDAYTEIIRECMIKEVMKKWKWIEVQLEVEHELCPIDHSWYEKYPLSLRDGKLEPSDKLKWEEKYGSWSLQI